MRRSYKNKCLQQTFKIILKLKIKMKFIVLSTLIAAYKASDVYTPLETNLLNTIENLLNGFVDTEYNLARKYR